MKSYFFYSDFSILKPHKTICVLLVLLIALNLILSGLVFDQLYTSDSKIKEFNYTIADQNYYKLCENLSDISDYRFHDPESSFYDSVFDFKNALSNHESFDYIVATNQFISVNHIKVPDECLYGYESGAAQNAVQTKDGVQVSLVKSMQVSDNFIDYYKIQISQGRSFYADEFFWKEGGTVPVIPGDIYKDCLQIGDQFTGMYLSKEVTFEVIGFLESNSAYSFGESVNSCDRQILMPSFNVTRERSVFNRMLLIQQINGIVVTKEDFQTANAIMIQLLEDNNLENNNDIFLRSPETSENVLQTYKAMSNEIMKQFIFLLITILAFSLFSLSAVIDGLIKEKQYEYGVCLLIGATWRHLKTSIVLLISKIVGISSAVSIVFLLLSGRSYWAIMFILAESVLIIFLSSIMPIAHLKNMDVSNIIGGKE